MQLQEPLVRTDFEEFLESSVAEWGQGQHPARKKLIDCVKYSLFSGGKRFRPQLSMLTAECLGSERRLVYPFAAAIEYVHTYSLLHDDLPCMDNDDFRRGKPSAHKQFDEATALLAGDTLLTESFFLLATHFVERADLAVALSRLLARASGSTGMIEGQMRDLNFQDSISKNASDIEDLHRLKTGALIHASVVGVAMICGCTSNEFSKLDQFAQNLGLAFQLADDLEDWQSGESVNFASTFGPQATRQRLQDVSTLADSALAIFGERGRGLTNLIEQNLKRTQNVGH